MGKEKTFSLGKYPLLSLKDAREKNFFALARAGQGHITSNSLLKFYKNLGYEGEMCPDSYSTSLKKLRLERDVVYLQVAHTPGEFTIQSNL